MAHDSRVLNNYTTFIKFINNLNSDNKIIGGQAYRGYEQILTPCIIRNGEIPNSTEEQVKQRLTVGNTFGLLQENLEVFIISPLMEMLKILLSHSQR